MRTLETTVYTISELSESAKERAHSQYLSNGIDYSWSSEARDVINEFAEIFPVSVRGWEVSTYGRSYVNFTLHAEDEVKQLSGHRLAKWLYNNYKWAIYDQKRNWKANKSRKSKIQVEKACLTGYCMGYDILEPIHEFISKPTSETLEDVMQNCFDAWVKSYVSDMEYQESLEYFEEMAEANDWEFEEDGTQA